jgi:leucyl/phenylalanyl-tRNA---protein transferase
MAVLTPIESYGSAQAEADVEFESLGMYADGSRSTTAPLFLEKPAATARRVALGMAYALRPNRLRLLPHAIGLTAEFMVSPGQAQRRLVEPKYRGWQGLVGISEDLSPKALLDGYRRGMFPFCHIGPMKWWSPNVRAVLHPEATRIEKNLRRVIRQGKYQVTFDGDFAAVMRACAEPRPGKTPLTWITPRMMGAFWDLHQAGHAHSVEVRDAEGELVGGLYGLAAGGVFFGESQFSLVRDASKVAVATLHCHLAHWGFSLRDAKWPTEHLASLGFHNMGRTEFLGALREHAWRPGRVGRWMVDESLDVSAWQTKA